MRKITHVIIAEAVAEIHEKGAYSRHIFSLLGVTGVMHVAEDAHLIGITWSCYWLDQFLMLALNMDFVMDLPTWGK